MVLDYYREKTIKGSIEEITSGKRRLESAVPKNINKRSQSSDIRLTYMETNKNEGTPKHASKRCNRKNEEDDDDDDAISVATTSDDAVESSGESLGGDAVASLSELETILMIKRPKVMPKRKRLNERVETKKKNPIANPQAKMKKSKFEFAAEPMDVSDEDEDKKVMEQEFRKYRSNPRKLSKKQLAVITAELKKRRKSLAAKMDKKSKKGKGKATPRKRISKKKKGRNDIVEEHCPDNSTCNKSRNVTEQKSSKQTVQNESNSGNNANNYNNDNAKRKANSVGDTRNVNNEKAAFTAEKKASSTVNKGPCHADMTAKASKENEKNEASKEPKAKGKVEDLSKKVDQKEIRDMDEGIAFQKFKQPSVKIMRMSSGKPPKKASPYIKFYMTVYRELCDSHSIRTIAKEAAKRWKGMSVEGKTSFTKRR